MFDLGFEK